MFTSKSSVAATVILVAYGREITVPDPLVELVELVLEQFSIGISPGAYLVEFFPMRSLFSDILILCVLAYTVKLSEISARMVSWCRVQTPSERMGQEHYTINKCSLSRC